MKLILNMDCIHPVERRAVVLGLWLTPFYGSLVSVSAVLEEGADSP